MTEDESEEEEVRAGTTAVCTGESEVDVDTAGLVDRDEETVSVRDLEAGTNV